MNQRTEKLVQRQMKRELEAAESLCISQLEKIRKQELEINKLKRQVSKLLSAIDEMQAATIETMATENVVALNCAISDI